MCITLFLGRNLKEENLSWIFIDKIPLLYNEKNIEKQQKIEKWLDLYQLTRELGIKDDKKTPVYQTSSQQEYIV
jgi:hypothetical protein